MSRYIDADLIEYHEEYDGQGFTRVAYADDIENLPDVELIDKGRLKFVIEKNFGHGTIEPILQLIDAQPTADVVEKSKYDKLKSKYDRLLENANYLAEAVREYQKREEEEHGN